MPVTLTVFQVKRLIAGSFQSLPNIKTSLTGSTLRWVSPTKSTTHGTCNKLHPTRVKKRHWDIKIVPCLFRDPGHILGNEGVIFVKWFLSENYCWYLCFSQQGKTGERKEMSTKRVSNREWEGKGRGRVILSFCPLPSMSTLTLNQTWLAG